MSKYRNKPTVIDDIRFASKREAARYCQLKLLEKAGDITGLELQPRYPLRVNDVLICVYVADFKFKLRDGREVVEDAKGVKTPTYRLKRKLMKAIHGIEIKEV